MCSTVERHQTPSRFLLVAERSLDDKTCSRIWFGRCGHASASPSLEFQTTRFEASDCGSWNLFDATTSLHRRICRLRLRDLGPAKASHSFRGSNRATDSVDGQQRV